MKKPAKKAGKPSPPKGDDAPAYIDAHEPNESEIEAIREQLRIARATEARIADLQSVLSEENKILTALKFTILPELFAKAGIDHLGLPAEGNLPPYDFTLRKFYRASIAADWDDNRREQAFAVLEKVGGADLIKTEVTVTLPREQRGMAKKVQAALKKLKVDYQTELSVPWNTLTAFVKEAIEKRKLILPLDKLGATAGMIVDMKERKSTDGASEKKGSTSRNVSEGTRTNSPEGTGRRR